MNLKRGKNKKGISAMLATTLIIIIAIALLVVIFFWIKNLTSEVVIKFDSNIKQSCNQVYFNTYKQGTQLNVENKGSVPIWKFEVYKKEGSWSKISYVNGPILSKETASLQDNEISGCQNLKIVPVLIGISQKTGTEKIYACTNKAKIINC